MKYIICVLISICSFVAHAQIITTIAGVGSPGYNGDGGSATAANLQYPSFITIDLDNNIFFAERLNNVIRKVSPSGQISTIAGNNSAGFSGDGGAATNAQLNAPVAVAVDKRGDIFISDVGNNRIRKVNAITGLITTVVGTGTASYSGDNGPAINATINYPIGIACDTSDNLFIADHLNFRIRKVDKFGIISTYGGNGVNGFSGDGGLATNSSMYGPNGLSCDRAGNIYICENRVRKISADNKIINTIAGDGTAGFAGDGGQATSAKLWMPLAVATDLFDNIYIADAINNRIRQINNSGIITTWVGNGVASFSGDGMWASSAAINNPSGIAIDSCGSLYISDEGNCRIRKVTYPYCHYLSITDLSEDNVGDLYPNPVNEILNINNISSTLEYRILNVMGSIEQQGTLMSGNNSLQINDLAQGIHILELVQGEKRSIRKFVKQ